MVECYFSGSSSVPQHIKHSSRTGSRGQSSVKRTQRWAVETRASVLDIGKDQWEIDVALTVSARDIQISPCCSFTFKLYGPSTWRSFSRFPRTPGFGWSTLSNQLVGQPFGCNCFCCDSYRKLMLHNSEEPCSLLC